MKTQADPAPIGYPSSPPTRISKRSSIVGGVVALALVAGLGGLAWYLTRPAAPASTAASGAGGGPAAPGGAGARRGPPASTVGVATAERASIPVVLDALGTVTPQASVKVRPQVTGTLEKVLFQEGQMVKAGQLLATIDPRQFELALMQAAGQRQRDEAQLESAKVTLQRYKTLLDQDSIARQDVDSQAALVKQLEGTVVIDRASEGTARLNLGYTRVVAPISGRVGLRTVDVGNVVSSGDANGVALITQVAPIDVVFSIAQDKVADLQPPARSAGGSGAAPAIKATAFDRTRAAVLDTGTFASLDNQVDTTTGTVKAKARFTNSQLLLFPNQFVNVQLLVRTIDNAVVVPITALRQGSAGDYVYVLNAADRTVSLRPVKRGQATVDKTVITSGLQAGEQVITEGADRLKDGARVVLAGDQGRTPGAGGAGGGVGGGADDRSGAKGKRQRPEGAASTPALAPASAASSPVATSAAVEAAPPVAVKTPAPAAPSAPSVAGSQASGPNPEQRQRMLDQVRDDPAALERRQRFLANIDSGDAQALARWKSMAEKRQQGDRSAP